MFNSIFNIERTCHKVVNWQLITTETLKKLSPLQITNCTVQYNLYTRLNVLLCSDTVINAHWMGTI